MNPTKYPDWQEPFEAVLRETDPQRLLELVRDADGAIFARMLALGDSPDENNELKALRDACDHLLIIKTKILNWPDPFGGSRESQPESRQQQ
jgi:hypothetical protein